MSHISKVLTLITSKYVIRSTCFSRFFSRRAKYWHGYTSILPFLFSNHSPNYFLLNKVSPPPPINTLLWENVCLLHLILILCEYSISRKLLYYFACFHGNQSCVTFCYYLFIHLGGGSIGSGYHMCGAIIMPPFWYLNKASILISNNRHTSKASILIIITKPPESGLLCGNIIEFGMGEDHLSQQGQGDLLPPQTNVILSCSVSDEGSFVFISCCLMGFLSPHV